jgi:hypothetical protein
LRLLFPSSNVIFDRVPIEWSMAVLSSAFERKFCQSLVSSYCFPDAMRRIVSREILECYAWTDCMIFYFLVGGQVTLRSCHERSQSAQSVDFLPHFWMLSSLRLLLEPRPLAI